MGTQREEPSVGAGQLTGVAASRNVHRRGLEMLLKATFVCAEERRCHREWSPVPTVPTVPGILGLAQVDSESTCNVA